MKITNNTKKTKNLEYNSITNEELYEILIWGSFDELKSQLESRKDVFNFLVDVQKTIYTDSGMNSSFKDVISKVQNQLPSNTENSSAIIKGLFKFVKEKNIDETRSDVYKQSACDNFGIGEDKCTDSKILTAMNKYMCNNDEIREEVNDELKEQIGSDYAYKLFCTETLESLDIPFDKIVDLLE